MNIIGSWLNELGSTLTITDITNGIVTGSYTTAVSASGCAQGTFTLTGSTDVDSGGSCIALTVAWKNDQSDCKAVTSWSGQFYELSDNNPLLLATWLLSMAQPSIDQAWQSTLVGEDHFFNTSSTKGTSTTAGVGNSQVVPTRPTKTAHP